MPNKPYKYTGTSLKPLPLPEALTLAIYALELSATEARQQNKPEWWKEAREAAMALTWLRERVKPAAAPGGHQG